MSGSLKLEMKYLMDGGKVYLGVMCSFAGHSSVFHLLHFVFVKVSSVCLYGRLLEQCIELVPTKNMNLIGNPRQIEHAIIFLLFSDR